MPQYVEAYGKTLEFPDGMSQDEMASVIRKQALSIGGKPKTSAVDGAIGGIGNLAAGALRGAGSIGATLLTPFDAAARAMGVSNDFIGRTDRRAQMDAGLQGLGADPDSWMFKGGKLGSEIAGTAGVGGTLAKGVASVPFLAKNAAPLINALGSGGMTVGQTAMTPAQIMAARIAGGAAVGGAAAGLVDPQDAGMGAVIGGALPPALKAVSYLGGKAAQGVGNLFLSPDAALARKVANVAGAKSADEIQAMRDLLTAPRPSNIGVDLTAAQALQNPGISQLQRSVQNAGNATVSSKIAEQNRAMLDALNRVSPVRGTVQDAAQDAGNAITQFAKAEEAKASKVASQLYNSVDPFNETRINLPIDAMQAQANKYLGPGTYGMGDKAKKAIDVAKQIGTETLDSIDPAKAAKEMTLLDAVKRAGGINPNAISSKQLSGEIADLRQSGLGRITNGRTGLSVEKMAENLYQRGFIPDDDPATLLNMLRDGGDTYATGGGMSSMRAALERSMGDAPQAETILKQVPYEQVKNFRESLVSDISKLKAEPGNKSEYAALVAMKKTLDDAIDKVASGGGAAGENFPADIAATWREANAAHAAKKARFNTGPQASLFRMGSDGVPAVQGGEVPRKFFNALRSQTDDIASFNNLVRGDAGPIDALKNYAVTSASNSTDRLGNLTNNKFNNWLDGHSGAVNGLFNEQDRAVLSQIGKHLKLADAADSLNIAKGSNTAQNVQAAMSNGLLDSPMVSLLANRIPVLKSVAGPALDGLRRSATQTRAEKLGGLLADPELLNEALGRYLSMQSAGGLLGYTPPDAMVQGLYRSAPVLLSGQ